MARSYTYLLGVSLLILMACSEKITEAAATKTGPNIIVVITDDQGYGDLGHTGNPVIKTPALDQFSAESVNLTNYHVGTTCAPTRAGLLTGRNCNRNGVWHTIMGASILNREERTMADVFRTNGYATGMFGKWHLGDNHPFLPHERGFERAFYHGGGGVGQTPDYWNNDYFDDTYFRNGIPEKQTGYCTDVWFDEAISFIEKKKDVPFFCYLSLNAPHGPFNVPEDYYHLYREEAIPEVQKRFYGMITNIDDNFAKLLAKLEEWDIADNTIVIFTTDNGTARGYQVDRENGRVNGFNAGMRGTKGSEYEGGHRVPMIIRWPDGGLSGGEKLGDLTAHVDMLPTLVALSGQTFSPAKTMDGRDISSYLLGTAAAPERMLVTDTQRVPWPVKGKNSCVMEGQWRLIRGTELYHIGDDPGQETDLAARFPDRVKRMNDFYETWWSDVIRETKLSEIALGETPLEVLTCHDARTTDQVPPWNQRMIRQGNPMVPAEFNVRFVAAGKYKFSLRRWPAESGLALNAGVNDAIPSTPFTDGRIEGEAMQITRAFLKIGEKEYTTDLEQNAGAAVIEAEVPLGKTELLAYFGLEDGTQSNAFYVYVEKMD
ncbi:arylsulfatase [Flavilitoribacter nigricans]|uniref:N-acetylgalactosamine 6-sulfate sulfatase n=1 Tax=Flavilitoribacter nigricans (strain ATCC 23147 / DSM 23189 / NBRC 102662 / NCIMB 1420 / SS-2) TaxID=1122177 RepID=A0A2D0N2Z5_FLAN2|nr:arylsulfatase [Flavilitoribacter nigricans]PHN02756.1 N-acetylgalactosamine 6-sulfate sulfatase [Flavilitoribacter nigricans DSM 23189 = NBRC 102662]